MKPRAMSIILLLIALPIMLFEYFVLFWFWGGAGIFNFFTTPIVFAVYLVGLVHLKKKLRVEPLINMVIKILLTAIVPILTIATVWLLALLFGIDVVIQ